MTGSVSLEPLREATELRAYIDAHWQKDHILARDPAMLRFTYATPWVDRKAFPAGFSVLGAYSGDDRLLGFLGAITAPYPRQTSYWLALWHVLAELKGSGMGGRLLQAMQDRAQAADGWIGTFGAGPEALPVYLKRGYLARASRRWTFDDQTAGPVAWTAGTTRGELRPPEEWLRYRFEQHPVFEYEVRDHLIARSESNGWGRVTHLVRMEGDSDPDVREIHAREHAVADQNGQEYVMDAWSFDCPGDGWTLADADVPSVFHPPENRGNLIYAVGKPFMPLNVGKGDCDQDRPN